jgi:hypothetical protein
MRRFELRDSPLIRFGSYARKASVFGVSLPSLQSDGQNANSVDFNGLLRTRTEWPRNRRATKKRDELAPS